MNKVEKLYHDLKNKHGKPKDQWQLWCKRPKTAKDREEVMIGAILTQQANWKNVELAMARLEESNLCSLRKIYNLAKKDTNKLGELIRPSGFYKQKAAYLFNLTEFVANNSGLTGLDKLPLDYLRPELLKVKGVGPETADSILLYALDKPSFVIDEYTRRLVKKKKISSVFGYEYLRNLFEKNLKRDYCLYQDFHALIVIDGKKR